MIKKLERFGRRKFMKVFFSVLAAGPLSVFSAQAGLNRFRNEKSKPRLGVNLTEISDWGAELPFLDLFLTSRDWISQSSKKNAKWSSGPKLDLDENGWVKHLPKNVYATRIICALEDGSYPSGDYVILYDGEGEIKPNFIAKIIKKDVGRIVVNVDSSRGVFWIDLIKTNPENYLRNIRVIVPGAEDSYLKNPWNPIFLERWQGVSCIRMMEFMGTNGSKQVKWNDRPKLGDISYAKKGVPVELMVDLANRLKSDVWFCMPHQAENEYISSFALYVKNHINDSSKIWVEYSNEVWNNQFEQAKYCIDMGRSLNLTLKDWEAGNAYSAYRSIEIFNLWNDVYLDQPAKIVRVLAAQAAYTGVAESMLAFKNSSQVADVLAIAPYFGLGVGKKPENGLSDKEVSSWTLDRLFKHIRTVSLADANKWVDNHKKIADKYQLKLVAYESGQHLVGIGEAVNNERLTQLFKRANGDSRMGELYQDYLNYWERAGGDLNCTYTSVRRWDKWGCFGLLKSNYEDPKKSAKFTAVIDWAVKQGQKMHY